MFRVSSPDTRVNMHIAAIDISLLSLTCIQTCDGAGELSQVHIHGRRLFSRNRSAQGCARRAATRDKLTIFVNGEARAGLRSAWRAWIRAD
jgi:hypothetical protein